MEGPLADIVLLGLLVTFFGIQQRNRPQNYFRFWLAGWMLVLCGFLAWGLRTVTPHSNALRAAIQHDALFLGGLAFLLSFVVQNASQKRVVFYGMLVAIPACTLFSLCRSTAVPFWLLACMIFAFEAALLHLVFVLLPREWARRRAGILALCFLFTFLLAVIARAGHARNLREWVLAQTFISAGILFTASAPNRPSTEWLIGTLGFLGWGLFYPLAHFLLPDPRLHLMLHALWNLPKYAVGFAMTIRIFDGTRDDVVRLAGRYKDLYEDFRLLYENHPLPMWIYDAVSARFLSVNAAATQSYGYTQSEFLDMVTGEDLMAPDLLAASAQPSLEDASHRTAQENNRARHRRKDGTSLAVELTEHEILFQGREARFVLAVDVTEREKFNQELFHRAQHDALTGLPNRALLDDRIAQCMLRNTRDHRKAVLFTIDADRFKLINDTHGHLVGDETLKAIADRLRSRIRSVDTIARTGGEEFTAIIGGLNTAEDAEKIANMFIRLFDTPLSLPGQDLKVSISIGAAIYPDDAQDAETLRKKSDQALYHAKHLGRNRFAFASSEVCASFDEAMAIELALRDAIRNQSFELFFQPVYSNTGCALHFETLLRMKPESANFYDPAVFIPVAEESSLIIPIGNWVVEQACKQLVAWRKLGGERITIGINVSGKQLLQKSFSGFVIETLREHGLSPTSLQIELTESSLMAEPALMREAMSELAGFGVRFAIDDFGIGYSSLARLADLPISVLKIDRSFIAQLEHVRRTDGIVTAIIHMAQTLNVQVVAEGVEDETQLNLLLRRGCDLFQGFYLAAPLSVGEMALALADGTPTLFAHPNFTDTRVAVSKRVRRVTQLPSFAAPAVGK